MPVFSCRAEEIDRTLAAVKISHAQSLKEIARHSMLRTGTIGILDRRRKLRGLHTADLLQEDVASTFKKTYSDGGWVHSDGQESLSGVGSSVEATRGLFDAVQSVMGELGAKSIVDVGCGDWNWMRHQNINVQYTGIDIVPEVIAGNQKYSNANVRFEVLNAIVQPPPPADMALAREVIFHLSFADAKALLRNLAAKTDYVCATTNANVWVNSDIRTGDYRLLNLMKRPFNFPRPIALIEDMAVSYGRFLAVWPRAAVLTALQ